MLNLLVRREVWIGGACSTSGIYPHSTLFTPFRTPHSAIPIRTPPFRNPNQQYAIRSPHSAPSPSGTRRREALEQVLTSCDDLFVIDPDVAAAREDVDVRA